MGNHRPKLLGKKTYRLPLEIISDIEAQAERRGVSDNEVVLCALENEFGRMATYRLDYYDDLRPLVQTAQGRQCPTGPENARQSQTGGL